MIEDFQRLFNDPSLPNTLGGDILISAHKDRVGFFVLQIKTANRYDIYCYGTIEKSHATALENLYIERTHKIIKVSLHHVSGPYYSLYTDEILIHGDFLSFQPGYVIEEETLIGPYLDNIIGTWIAEKIQTTYNNVDIFQAIDEEASLQYSIQQKNYKLAIIVDTIQQEYVEAPLDYKSIYSVTETSFTSLESHVGVCCQPLSLKVGFTLEPDIINADKKYFLLCPIDGGHVEKSKVNINTVRHLLSVITHIISNESN